jgi:hypothetical protein
LPPKSVSAKRAPSRSEILSDIAAALVRDTAPTLPDYEPEHELTITDMLKVKAGWNRVKMEREMKDLLKAGTWQKRRVMVMGEDGIGKRRATAYRPKPNRKRRPA